MIVTYWNEKGELVDSNSIGPEIGISYLPYTLLTANRKVESKRVDLVFGINAELPIADKWKVNSRISYSKREAARWRDMLLIPTTNYREYRHQDLNIDFSLYYHFADIISIGLGPSVVKKMNSSVSTYYFPEAMVLYGLENFSRDENHVLFEVNSGIKLTKGRFNLNMRYFRRLKNKINFLHIIGKNKLELTLNVMILGYKNKKE